MPLTNFCWFVLIFCHFLNQLFLTRSQSTPAISLELARMRMSSLFSMEAMGSALSRNPYASTRESKGCISKGTQ